MPFIWVIRASGALVFKSAGFPRVRKLEGLTLWGVCVLVMSLCRMNKHHVGT